jgi:hypothetical protein
MGNCFVQRPEEDHPASAKQQYMVEELRDARVGLVDAHHHTQVPFASLHDRMDRAKHFKRDRPIQAAGRLIQQQQWRRCYELCSDFHALFLPSRYASAKDRADGVVRDGCQPKVLQQ